MDHLCPADLAMFPLRDLASGAQLAWQLIPDSAALSLTRFFQSNNGNPERLATLAVRHVAWQERLVPFRIYRDGPVSYTHLDVYKRQRTYHAQLPHPEEPAFPP